MFIMKLCIAATAFISVTDHEAIVDVDHFLLPLSTPCSPTRGHALSGFFFWWTDWNLSS